MLLHLSSRHSYWFCSHCRLEMSNSDDQTSHQKGKVAGFNSASLKAAIAPLKSEQPVVVV